MSLALLSRSRKSSGRIVWPPSGPYAAQAPFPSGTYDYTIPANQIIPKGPDKRWPRANWFSVEVPDYTGPQMSAQHPKMVLTYELHLVDDANKDRVIKKHVSMYSHIMFSWCDARNESGYTPQQFTDLCVRAKMLGIPFVHAMLAGKNTDPHNVGWDILQANIDPVLNLLIKNQAIDMVSFWETDLWQGPNLQSNYDGIAKYSVDQWAHFSTHTVWWGPYNNRVEFWEAQLNKLVGILYQGDVSWDIPMRQARICDTTNNASAAPRFADGTFKFCAAEMDGMSIYDPNFSENIANRNGYLHICTNGIVPVHGYCSGGCDLNARTL